MTYPNLALPLHGANLDAAQELAWGIECPECAASPGHVCVEPDHGDTNFGDVHNLGFHLRRVFKAQRAK